MYYKNITTNTINVLNIKIPTNKKLISLCLSIFELFKKIFNYKLTHVLINL